MQLKIGAAVFLRKRDHPVVADDDLQRRTPYTERPGQGRLCLPGAGAPISKRLPPGVASRENSMTFVRNAGRPGVPGLLQHRAATGGQVPATVYRESEVRSAIRCERGRDKIPLKA